MAARARGLCGARRRGPGCLLSLFERLTARVRHTFFDRLLTFGPVELLLLFTGEAEELRSAGQRRPVAAGSKFASGR